MRSTVVVTIIRLVVSLAISLGAGVIGSILTNSSIPTWYAGLTKPSFNPPNWLFGPVWTVLFILMGVALFLVWNQLGLRSGVIAAIIVFIVQLVLNVAWSGVFFTLHAPLAGLVVIGFLWAAILVTIIFFGRVVPVAGILLVPYILWVSFAAVLNAALYLLNR